MNLDLKNLNEEQKRAATFGEGPLLIVAGAGTGKTTVITQRLAWLIAQNKTKGNEILALTFTDKAATEMEERVDRALPYGYLDLWVSTFHSFGQRILEQHALEVGLPNNFKLLNQTQQWILIRQNFERFDLDYFRPLGYPTKFITALVKHFSRCKDEDISPAEYLKFAQELKLNSDSTDFIKNLLDEETRQQLSKKELKELASQEIKKINELANAYHTYQQLLLQNSALDFGDLIIYCLKLFKERPAILARYRKQFKYILVDEFQDTNWAQYELVKLLAAPKNNITVVGDDDQCLPPQILIKTEAGEKMIKEIKEGDRVLTAVGRGYLSYSLVTKVFKQEKLCKFITFKTAGGRQIKVTDNHKMFCLVPAVDDRKYYYIYLMYRVGLGWRLGVTNDLATRLRLERSADKIIGIKTCKTELETRFFETLYSLKYKLPTVCFQARPDTVIKDEWLEKLYQAIDTEENAKKLAQDLNIDLNCHHYCLAAVNRGNKVRIKINLEMCHRKYRSKFAKNSYLKSPQIFHCLSLETSDLTTLKKLKRAGFPLRPAKKGYRLRIASPDLKFLGAQALQLEKVTSGIIEISAKLGRTDIQTKKSLVIPAKNVLIGQYLPVITKKGIIFDRVIKKTEQKLKTATVYDLEIKNTHNFVANGVVVHNSIYKFRGASVSNILEFKQDYPNSEEVVLVKNYRSTQDILDLSYKFIKQNDPNRLEYQLSNGTINKSTKVKSKAGITLKQKISKQLQAKNIAKGEVLHLHAETNDDEVKTVIEKIITLKKSDGQSTWNDFAILVRANDSANPFIAGLANFGIPYQFVASRGLYAKTVVIDIINYLKLLDNYHESSALYRTMSIPVFSFDHRQIINLNYWSSRKNWSLYESLQRLSALPNVNEETIVRSKKLLSLIDKHSALTIEKNVGEVIYSFLEDSGYLKYLTSKDDAWFRQQVSFLNQFYKKVKEFEQGSDNKSVKAFLDQLNLESDAGELGALAPTLEEGPEAVKIMTIHAAKGLEFKYVFVANLVDRRFPTTERKDPIELPDSLVKEIIPEGDIHLQEERRLFYVAMTRAKQGLYFTSAEDYGGQTKKKLSRFLTELNSLGFKLAAGPKARIKSSAELITSAEIEDISYAIPKKFSFSQLRAFEICPWQYRYAFVLSIPIRGKAVFSFGQTIHSTLQKFFRLVIDRTAVEQRDLFGEKVKTKEEKKVKAKEIISLEELLKIYAECWLDDWYESKKQKQDYYKKGIEVLKNLYKDWENNLPIPKSLEEWFNLKLVENDEIYTLAGRIDRIDEAQDGKVEIIDYKTGAPKYEEKMRPEDKEQLLIYQLAAQEFFGDKISGLTFHYVENNHKVTFLGTEKDLERIKQKVIKIIKEIKKGKFIPTPGPICKTCDFRGICEFRAY